MFARRVTSPELVRFRPPSNPPLTPDTVFVRRICEHFGHDRFSWRDVLVVLNEHAEWLEINRHVRQKTI